MLCSFPAATLTGLLPQPHEGRPALFLHFEQRNGMKPILPVVVPRPGDELDPSWVSLVELGWPGRLAEITEWASKLPLDADGLPPRDGPLVTEVLGLIQALRGKRVAGSVTANRTGLIRLLPEPLPLVWRGGEHPEADDSPPTFPGRRLSIELRMPAPGEPPLLTLRALPDEAGAAPEPLPDPDEPTIWDDDLGREVTLSELRRARLAAAGQPDNVVRLHPAPSAVAVPEPCAILLPHESHSPDPTTWWPLELLLRADPAVVAEGWAGGRTAPRLPDDLARTLLPQNTQDPAHVGLPGSAIRTAFDSANIPLKRAAGITGTGERWQLDLETWALDIVTRRYHATGELPQLFLVGRRAPNVIWHRVMGLLKAVHRGRLYRTSVEPGKCEGLLTVVKSIAGQDGMRPVRDENDIHYILGTSIEFPSRRYGLRQPPAQLVKMMRSEVEPSLPELRGIVHMPICQPDGTVINRAGYDPITKEWRDSSVTLDVPERPTARDAIRALDTLNVMLQDFSFDSTSGAYAGALACFFDQIIRPLVRARHGPRPLFVFEARAHGQGSGKSLLAMVIAAAITGNTQAAQPWKGREEFAKTVVGALQKGSPFVLIDNVTTMVRNDVLDLLLTAPEFEDRQLGSNRVLRLPQNTTWAMTVNGVHLSKDLARRTVLSRLEKSESEPDAYAIREIIGYAIQHRDALISAAFTILRAWIQAGQPPGPEIEMRSYSTWIRIMSGLFGFVGVTGLDRCIQAAKARDADSGEDQLFFESVVESGRVGETLTTEVLINIAEAALVYTKRLDKRDEHVRKRALSEHLRTLVGLTVAGHQIEIVRQRSPVLFRFVPASKSTSSAGPAA